MNLKIRWDDLFNTYYVFKMIIHILPIPNFCQAYVFYVHFSASFTFYQYNNNNRHLLLQYQRKYSIWHKYNLYNMESQLKSKFFYTFIH